MPSYRFCRTDDMPLLVEAYNRCYAAHLSAEPAITLADFKRDVRELNLWCSSSMVAFAGEEPVGVLLAAKREKETLVHRIGTHPDHRRRGHARHLLTSLSAKLAILGPPRIVAEVPCDLEGASALFEACGYFRVSAHADFVLESPLRWASACDMVVPVTLADLEASAALDESPARCWERSRATLMNRRDAIRGLAIATDERIEAYLLHRETGPESPREIAALHGVEALLGLLVRHYAGQDPRAIRIPKVSPAEIPSAWLESWGFRPEREYVGYAAAARPG